MNSKTESFLGWTFIVAVVILVVGGFGLLVHTIVMDGQKQEKMDNICSYLHADVQGDVCVKDGQVVYTYHK